MTSEIQFKKNYLAMIKNSARGENLMFRNFYIILNGLERDALNDGALGCGVLVSSILYLQNSTLEFLEKPKWISYVHAKVQPTEKDLEQNGWRISSDLKEGAVLTWEARPGKDGLDHQHIGFYIGNDQAISNGSNTSQIPEEHHFTYDGTRKIERIWWHPELD